MVDAEIVFGKPTPLKLICMFKPDVVVKGGDYCRGSRGSARRMHAAGAVKTAPTVEGLSTTRLIARIAQPELKLEAEV